MDKIKNDYKSKGYVLIKNFFTDKEANQIVKYANELEQWEETPFKWMIYFEKDKNTQNKFRTRIENFICYHLELNDFFYSKISPLMNELYGDKMILFKDKLNWKIGGGKGFKAHQDHPAWNDFEPTNYATVALFANNSTIENGCLEFGTSDKKIKCLCPYNKTGLGELDIEYENSLNWTPQPSTPKDLLIFDSFVPHRSHENKTNDPRRIFYFTLNQEKYGNLYDEYTIKKRTEFPPDIERKDNNNIKIHGNKYNLANPIE